MNKKILIVPKGVDYISQWKDYDITNFNFPHILNKKLTGCGFTEYCIRCQHNIILCSPRKILLENKKKQHKDDVFYFKNQIELETGYENDIGKLGVANKKEYISKEALEELIKMKQEASNYWNSCVLQNKPCKILVTYDSFHYIREILGNDILNFYIVIDEFQSIFMDAAFKSNTELNFLNDLQGLSNICMASATPMFEPYLDMLDEFKSLPYFELDWSTADSGRVIKPGIEVKKSTRPLTELNKVIKAYLDYGYYPEPFVYRDNQGNTIKEVYSREGVFYVNSVTTICGIVKRLEIPPEKVNIICSRTKENARKIRAAFGLSKKKMPNPIGDVPLAGEPHKLLTFCTRTVYLGADFYSDNAKTYILSDANINTLVVDISIDLAQIIGRQRSENNPWKNRATMYVKTCNEFDDPNNFTKYIDEKKLKTGQLLKIYQDLQDQSLRSTLSETYRSAEIETKYRSNYVTVKYDNLGKATPDFNTLMLVAELRAFELKQTDYLNWCSVKASINNNYFIDYPQVVKALSLIEVLPKFPDKMKVLLEETKTMNEDSIKTLLRQLPVKFGNYYNNLSQTEILNSKYRESSLSKLLSAKMKNQNSEKGLVEDLKNEFIVGKKYTNSYIKDKLLELYTKHNYILGWDSTITAKASDIEIWFNVRSILVADAQTNKRVRGYEIKSIKNP